MTAKVFHPRGSLGESGGMVETASESLERSKSTILNVGRRQRMPVLSLHANQVIHSLHCPKVTRNSVETKSYKHATNTL